MFIVKQYNTHQENGFQISKRQAQCTIVKPYNLLC